MTNITSIDYNILKYITFIYCYICQKDMNQRQSQEMISIKLDASTVSKINKLGFMDETIPKFVEKMVEHLLTCEKWWWDRDQERGL